MNEKIIKSTRKEISCMLSISEDRLEKLLLKHRVTEQRKTHFFWIGFLWTCFICLLHGKTRHKDRSVCYNGRFGGGLSESISSDRLTVLPTTFLRDLLHEIQHHGGDALSKKKRKPVHRCIDKLIAEDATVFRLDQRLANIFKRIPGSQTVGLKLYTHLTVFGGLELHARIKHARYGDARCRRKSRNRNQIEVRDRGWFSMKVFVAMKNEKRYFISRIQKQFNPKIVRVIDGDANWKSHWLQSINLKGHTEVDFEVKPYRGKETIYRLANHQPFTLRMKGKKVGGDWYWYIYSLPKSDQLSFADIHALYRTRWQIEEMFREIKQAFGGDHLRLHNPRSVVNHLFMMLIGYIMVKGFINQLAVVHRKSLEGFALDTMMKGYLRYVFIQCFMKWIQTSNQTKVKLRKWSQLLIEHGYSTHRSCSGKKSQLGKAMAGLNQKG